VEGQKQTNKDWLEAKGNLIKKFDYTPKIMGIA